MQGWSHKQKQNKTKKPHVFEKYKPERKKSSVHVEDGKLFFFFSFFKSAKLINIREDYTFPGSGMLHLGNAMTWEELRHEGLL